MHMRECSNVKHTMQRSQPADTQISHSSESTLATALRISEVERIENRVSELFSEGDD